MAVRFISDLHKGHENLIRNHRGFSDAYHHDENLITQWNLVCHKKDVIYIQGDITMEKNDYSFLDRLNGIKHVIGGNHEKLNAFRYLEPYIHGFGGYHKYRSKEFRGYKFWLSHCPIHPMELDIDYSKGIKAFNIHGHIHTAYKIPDKRYINVSAEVINYQPKTLKELLNE